MADLLLRLDVLLTVGGEIQPPSDPVDLLRLRITFSLIAKGRMPMTRLPLANQENIDNQLP